MRPYLPDVSSQYGSPMGRAESYCSVIPAGRLRIYRVPIDSGGYDPCGAYWGLGAPLYCVEGDGLKVSDTWGRLIEPEDIMFCRYYRAADRADAYRRMALKFGSPHPLKRSV